MDCEYYRERFAADPAHPTEAMMAHTADCPACAAYAARLAAGERLLQEALRFDVNALKKAAEAGRGVAFSRAGKRLALGGLAAVLVAALGLLLVLGRGRALSDDELAAAVIDHWYHEPEAWVQTSATVSDALLSDVLEGELALDLTRIGTVSYAKTCYVAGRWIPHLIVQGQQGPVMVLLMPERGMASPFPIALPEEGLAGLLAPLDGGSIALLGEDNESIELIEQQVAAAVDWAI